MQQRPTTTFQTTSGKTIVLNTYLTGGEANSVKESILKYMEADMSKVVADEKESKFSGLIPGEFVLEQEKKLVSYYVVSVDGVSENPLSLVESLPNHEYQEIIKEINRINTSGANLVSAK